MKFKKTLKFESFYHFFIGEYTLMPITNHNQYGLEQSDTGY